MPRDQYLPIKVVFPSKADYYTREPRGGDPKVFTEVTSDFRQILYNQVIQVRDYFDDSFRQYPDMPAVAKIALHEDASAKSHRPNKIFNDNTCPVIGIDNLGQLLISVTDDGLRKVASTIISQQSRESIAHISSLKAINPWTVQNALSDRSTAELLKEINSRKCHNVKCRLFHHKTPQNNQAIHEAFLKMLGKYDISDYQEVKYSADSTVFAIPEISEDKIIAVSRFAGAQSLSPFSDYKIVQTAATVIGSLTPDHLPPPESNASHGLVGLIDSGTDVNNHHLQAWVHDRFDWVPPSQQNNSHGSFVAGLLINGRALNHGDIRFPSASSKIVDVVALDKDGRISEFDLLTVIDSAIDKYPNVKVWNLSLGLDECCHEMEFSELASALDERSSTHKVLFLIAAGNYCKPPLRSWPPPDSLQEDRICPPGDSIRSITVGALAHIESPATFAKREEPSPFSRRGPAPSYLIKPELTHYGGNCDGDGNYSQTGIISIDNSGHIAEDIGTSFATPLVATLAANTWNELSVSPESVSPLLVKAMAIHSAFLKRIPTDINMMNYYGIGVPGDLHEVVACAQSSATVILQIPVPYGPRFEKQAFPMPTCLQGESGLKGEVLMTLLHDTPIDRNYGSEYCRSNIDASLGTLKANKETGELTDYTRQIHPTPKYLTDGFEKDVRKQGFKWSPLKFYYRNFSKANTLAGRQWRLTLNRLDRAEYKNPVHQDVFLVLTIRDPKGKAYVYDEIVRSMNTLGWINQDLQIRSRTRLQS